jgi:hypothetical protein
LSAGRRQDQEEIKRGRDKEMGRIGKGRVMEDAGKRSGQSRGENGMDVV